MRLCPAFAPSVLLRRRAARSSHRSTACLAGEGTDRVALANRLSLLGRLQETSVSQQDFAAAAKYRDERNGLLASLNTSERLLQTDLDCLRTGTPAQRAAAVQRLGECGDGTLAELVAPSLHDSDSTVHAATEEALWSLWRCSGDKDADKLFAKAVSVLQVGAVTGADALRQSLALLNELVEKYPLFSEGFNKRATVLYLLNEHAASLEDCKKTVELAPSHFGALSGGGMCCLQMSDKMGAVRWFQRATVVNPRLDSAKAFIEKLGMEKKDDEPGTDLIL